MTATIEEGRDAISGLIVEALLADETGEMIVEADPTRLLWWNKPGEPPKADDEDTGEPLPWLKVEIRHVGGGQSTLSGADGTRRTTRTGVVLVKCHEALGTGGASLDRLVRVLESAFLAKRADKGVWFRNVRTPEFGPDGTWFRHDVVADFTYDDFVN